MNITDIAQYAGWGLLAIFVIIVLVLGFMLYKDRTPKPKEAKVKQPKQKKEKKTSEPAENKVFDPMANVKQDLNEQNDSLFSTETARPATSGGFAPTPVVEATPAFSERPVLPARSAENNIPGGVTGDNPVQQPTFNRPQMPSIPKIPQPQGNNPRPPQITPTRPGQGQPGGPPVLKGNAPASLFSKNNDNK